MSFRNLKKRVPAHLDPEFEGFLVTNFKLMTFKQKKRKMEYSSMNEQSSWKTDQDCISDLRTYLRENRVALKLRQLIEKLEEENTNLTKELENIGMKKIFFEELADQKIKECEKLDSNLLTTKIDVTALNLEVYNETFT